MLKASIPIDGKFLTTAATTALAPSPTWLPTPKYRYRIGAFSQVVDRAKIGKTPAMVAAVRGRRQTRFRL